MPNDDYQRQTELAIITKLRRELRAMFGRDIVDPTDQNETGYAYDLLEQRIDEEIASALSIADGDAARNRIQDVLEKDADVVLKRTKTFHRQKTEETQREASVKESIGDFSTRQTAFYNNLKDGDLDMAARDLARMKAILSALPDTIRGRYLDDVQTDEEYLVAEKAADENVRRVEAMIDDGKTEEALAAIATEVRDNPNLKQREAFQRKIEKRRSVERAAEKDAARIEHQKTKDTYKREGVARTAVEKALRMKDIPTARGVIAQAASEIRPEVADVLNKQVDSIELIQKQDETKKAEEYTRKVERDNAKMLAKTKGEENYLQTVVALGEATPEQRDRLLNIQAGNRAIMSYGVDPAAANPRLNAYAQDLAASGGLEGRPGEITPKMRALGYVARSIAGMTGEQTSRSGRSGGIPEISAPPQRVRPTSTLRRE